MSYFFPFTLLLLTLTACSGNDKSTWPLPPQEEVATQDNGRNNRPTSNTNSTVGDDFVLRETYNGLSLVLNFPHDTNLGEWRIQQDEAEGIYHSLLAEPIIGNEFPGWLPMETKYGRHITCFKQARSESPDLKIYSCTISFDYVSGLVYENTSLRNAEAVDESTITVNIQGNDAKALYLTLDVSSTSIEIEGNVYNEKKNMLECLSSTTVSNYACSIHLKTSTGEIVLPQ